MSRRLQAILVLVLALLAARAAEAQPWLGLLLPAGLLALGAALILPGAYWLSLLSLVILQDTLQASPAAILRLRYVDEAMVLTALAALSARWAWRAWRWIERQATEDGTGRPPAATSRLAQRATTPFDLPLLAFIAAGCLGALINRVPPLVASLGLLSLLKGMLCAALIPRLLAWPSDGRTLARLKRGLALLGLILAFAGLVGLAQRLGGQAVYALSGQLAHFEQWQGSKTPAIFFNHNAFGHAMLLAGALALGMLFYERSRSAGRPATARGWWALALISLLGLLISASRESWIGAAFGLLLGALGQGSRKLLALALALSLGLGLAGAGLYASSESLRAELARRSAGVTDGWRDYRLGFEGWEFKGEYRVYILLKSWQVFLDHPLWGTGPGRFGSHVAARYESPLYESYRVLPLEDGHIAFDVFWSRLLAEFGLLGSAAYLWFLFMVFRTWLSAARSRAGPATQRADDAGRLRQALGLGGLVAGGAMLAVGWFSPNFEDPLVSIPIYAWAGLVWAMARGTGEHQGGGPGAAAEAAAGRRPAKPGAGRYAPESGGWAGGRTAVAARTKQRNSRVADRREPRVLLVTNMWPTAADPAFGSFVRQQVADLRLAAPGLVVERLYIDGRRSRLEYLWAIPRLRRALAEGDWDLVHAHYVLSGLAAWLAGAGRARGGPALILTQHGIEIYEGWQARLSAWLTPRVDRCLVVGRAMAEHLELPEQSVLPCGIDLERFRPGDRQAARDALGLELEPRAKLVAWVGADRPEKRLGLARQSLARLRQRVPEARLLEVIGRPPSEVPRWLQAADALLVSSRREGGPLVIKEALACGLPVVSTDVGLAAELLEGLPGCSIRAGEPDALAAGLAEALRVERLDATERLQAHGSAHVAQRLAEIYREIAGLGE